MSVLEPPETGRTVPQSELPDQPLHLQPGGEVEIFHHKKIFQLTMKIFGRIITTVSGQTIRDVMRYSRIKVGPDMMELLTPGPI